MIRERGLGFLFFLGGGKDCHLGNFRNESSGSEGFARVEVSFFIVVAWITNWRSLKKWGPKMIHASGKLWLVKGPNNFC